MRWYNVALMFIQQSAPTLRSTRQVNLALLSAAVLSRRKLSLSILARALPVSLSPAHRHRKKRLFRFLSNDKFDPVHAQTEMMAQIIKMSGLTGLTPIMIDWSDLGRGFNGLFAAVCFRGRGLPLLSWVSRPQELTPSQNHIEEFFIRRLMTHMPDTVHPVLLADRGFGRASLLGFLQQLPRVSGYAVDYIVRLRGDVIVQTDNFRGRLRDYPLPKQRSVFIQRVHYRQDQAVRTNLVLFWGRGHKEPWFLATSLSDPRLVVKMYRRRMQPEQYFKDGKQRFDLDSATVTTTSRMQRLLVAVLLACCLLILAGIRTSRSFRRQVCSWGRLGVLHLGLEYYLATTDPPPHYFGLSQP